MKTTDTLSSIRLSTAPMMEWSDRHCRAFWRVLTKEALLYTEMVTANAVIHGHREHLIGYNDVEHPVALQLGGSDPVAMAEAAKIAEDYGYDEVNINCGCPSDRVKSGFFGACLMENPDLVARCVEAMRNTVDIPVTVKNRIGIDDQEDYKDLLNFVDIVHRGGANHFIIHARKAWLQGLSPKENREIPPLRYDLVHQIKQERPELDIAINGGITTLQQSLEHLETLDGVMLGRAAYQDPWVLRDVDELIFNKPSSSIANRHEALEAYFPYIEQQLSQGMKLHYMTRHIIGLFNGQPGGKQFRRYISENAYRSDADLDVLKKAMEKVPRNNEAEL